MVVIHIPAFLAADNVSRFTVSGISLLSTDVVDEIIVVGADEVAMVVILVLGFEVVVVVVVVIGFVGLKVD